MSNCDREVQERSAGIVLTPAAGDKNLTNASSRESGSRLPDTPEAVAKPEKAGLKIGLRWVVAAGCGTFAASFLNDLPAVQMIQAMAQSKISMLTPSVSKILISASTTAISILGTYLTLTILWGLYHVTRHAAIIAYYTLYGIWTLVAGFLKNSGKIGSVVATIIFPAQAIVKSNKKNGWGCYAGWMIFLHLFVLLMAAANAISTGFNTLNKMVAVELSAQALVTLYTIGRYARKRKEKATA